MLKKNKTKPKKSHFALPDPPPTAPRPSTSDEKLVVAAENPWEKLARPGVAGAHLQTGRSELPGKEEGRVYGYGYELQELDAQQGPVELPEETARNPFR